MTIGSPPVHKPEVEAFLTVALEESRICLPSSDRLAEMQQAADHLSFDDAIVRQVHRVAQEVQRAAELSPDSGTDRCQPSQFVD